MKVSQTERDEALATLRKHVKRGATVFTVLRHVSKSGMSRLIDCYVVKKGEPLRLTWSVGKAVGYVYDRKGEALRVKGCGMDMGFDVVYNLGRTLWPKGVKCSGAKCQSNDHSHGIPRDGCKALYHDSGHTLRQRWL